MRGRTRDVEKAVIAKDSQVKALTHSGGRYEDEHRVAGAAGLILEVGRPRADGTSVKRWKFVKRYAAGGKKKKHKVVLGAYPAMGLRDARTAAARAAIELAEGGAARRACGTFADLVADYVAANQHLKRIVERERELRKDAVAIIGAKPASEVTPQDIERVLDAILARGAKSMAYRQLEGIKAIYNFCLLDSPILADRYGITSNPADRLWRRRRGGKARVGRNPPKERHLTDAEIVAFWSALSRAGIDPRVRAALRLILVTAQRPVEVRQA